MVEHRLREDILNILRLLSSQENLTQRDLSSHMNISLGKANYLLKELIKKNLIKARNFSKGSNKINKVRYILTKKGLEEKISLTYHFLRRKETEYNHIKQEWEAIRERLPRQSEAEK